MCSWGIRDTSYLRDEGQAWCQVVSSVPSVGLSLDADHSCHEKRPCYGLPQPSRLSSFPASCRSPLTDLLSAESPQQLGFLYSLPLDVLSSRLGWLWRGHGCCLTSCMRHSPEETADDRPSLTTAETLENIFFTHRLKAPRGPVPLPKQMGSWKKRYFTQRDFGLLFFPLSKPLRWAETVWVIFYTKKSNKRVFLQSSRPGIQSCRNLHF